MEENLLKGSVVLARRIEDAEFRRIPAAGAAGAIEHGATFAHHAPQPALEGLGLQVSDRVEKRGVAHPPAARHSEAIPGQR
jgi:hypothetical protein